MGSVALHVGLITLLWPSLPPRIVSRHPFVIQAKLITAKLETVPATPVDAPAAPAALEQPAPLPAALPPSLNTPEPAPVPEPPAPLEPAGYLPIDAVDEAAVPLADWAIDTDVLPRGYTLRLVLQLWISAQGSLDRWEILGDTANRALAQKALANLADTPIQPALLHQVAVPSFRQLEVVVTRD